MWHADQWELKLLRLQLLLMYVIKGIVIFPVVLQLGVMGYLLMFLIKRPSGEKMFLHSQLTVKCIRKKLGFINKCIFLFLNAVHVRIKHLIFHFCIYLFYRIGWVEVIHKDYVCLFVTLYSACSAHFFHRCTLAKKKIWLLPWSLICWCWIYLFFILMSGLMYV